MFLEYYMSKYKQKVIFKNTDISFENKYLSKLHIAIIYINKSIRK